MRTEMFYFRKSLSRLCTTLLIVNILLIFLGVICYSLFDNANRSFEFSFLMGILSTMSYIIPFGVLALRLGLFNDEPKRKRFNVSTQFNFFCTGLLVIVITNLLTNIFIELISKQGVHLKTNEIQKVNDVKGMMILIISDAVFPALVEEFVFRGVILGELRKYNVTAAILLSMFLFSIMHGNIPQILFTLPFGFYTAFLYIKTGSLKIPVMLHFFNNMSAVVLSAVSDNFNHRIYTMFYIALDILFLIFGILGFLELKRKKLLSLRQENSYSIISNDDCISSSFTTLPFIIFCVIEGLFIIRTISF